MCLAVLLFFLAFLLPQSGKEAVAAVLTLGALAVQALRSHPAGLCNGSASSRLQLYTVLH